MGLNVRNLKTALRPVIFGVIVAVILSSCGSVAPVLDSNAILGHWQNRSGGFFRLSWDQCEFLANQRFACTSYPLKDDVVLTYDGTWSLAGNQLQLRLGQDQSYIYYVIETGQDSFTVDSRISGVRTFYRMKDIN